MFERIQVSSSNNCPLSVLFVLSELIEKWSSDQYESSYNTIDNVGLIVLRNKYPSNVVQLSFRGRGTFGFGSDRPLVLVQLNIIPIIKSFNMLSFWQIVLYYEYNNVYYQYRLIYCHIVRFLNLVWIEWICKMMITQAYKILANVIADNRQNG